MKPLFLAYFIALMTGCTTHTVKLVCYGTLGKCWENNFPDCYKIVDFTKKNKVVYKVKYREECE